jgi:hypothetical protein
MIILIQGVRIPDGLTGRLPSAAAAAATHLRIFQVTMTTMTTMENFYCCIVISIVGNCVYCTLYCYNHLCIVNSIVFIVIIALYCNLVYIV